LPQAFWACSTPVLQILLLCSPDFSWLRTQSNRVATEKLFGSVDLAVCRSPL